MSANFDALKTELAALQTQVAANVANEDAMFAAVRVLKDQLAALQAGGGATEADLQTLIDTVVPMTQTLTAAVQRNTLPADTLAPPA